MTLSKTLFSSKTDDWYTPQYLFDELNSEFHFTLDPCANDQNHKCDMYFTKQDDGISKNWGGIQYSAILRMAEESVSGYRKHQRNLRNRTQLLSC